MQSYQAILQGVDSIHFSSEDIQNFIFSFRKYVDAQDLILNVMILKSEERFNSFQGMGGPWAQLCFNVLPNLSELGKTYIQFTFQMRMGLKVGKLSQLNLLF